MRKIILVLIFDYNIFINSFVDVKDLKNEEFAEKVLNEFDKIFHSQLNRMEKHFRRESQIKKASYSHKKNSVEKNYYEWKPKAGNDIWAETLRGRNSTARNSEVKEKYIKYENPNDEENQIEATKEKIKNSIKLMSTSNNIENSTILNRSQSTKNFSRNEGLNNKNTNSSSKILNFNNDLSNTKNTNSARKLLSNDNRNINFNLDNNNFNNNKDIVNSNSKNKLNLQYGLNVQSSGMSKNMFDKEYEFSLSPNRSKREIIMTKNRINKQR